MGSLIMTYNLAKPTRKDSTRDRLQSNSTSLEGTCKRQSHLLILLMSLKNGSSHEYIFIVRIPFITSLIIFTLSSVMLPTFSLKFRRKHACLGTRQKNGIKKLTKNALQNSKPFNPTEIRHHQCKLFNQNFQTKTPI